MPIKYCVYEWDLRDKSKEEIIICRGLNLQDALLIVHMAPKHLPRTIGIERIV